MLLVSTLSAFIAISALMVAVSSRRFAARAAIDYRLRRARGDALVAPSSAGAPALRQSRFGSNGGIGRALAGVRSMQRLSDKLDRAGWRLSVVEFLALCGVSAMVAGLVARAVLAPFTLLAALVAAFVPLLLLARGVKGRRNKFVAQLVEALSLVASALKAGVGLLQALDQAAGQLKPPIADELRRTLRDTQLGATPDEAFNALSERVKSDDLDIVTTAIIVQRGSGGNLAEILENVAATMRERIRIRGEIKTLTVQQQFSGYLVALLPIGLLVVLTLINRSYMMPIFTTVSGHVILGVGGTMQVVGLLFVRKIVNIEV